MTPISGVRLKYFLRRDDSNNWNAEELNSGPKASRVYVGMTDSMLREKSRSELLIS